MLRIAGILLLLLVTGCRSVATAAEGPLASAPPRPMPLEPLKVKNIILFVGDGMGLEAVRAASLFETGSESGLSFQKFPVQTVMTHDSVDGVTDSAASATALATGVKVSNGTLSVAIPGDGGSLPTLLEWYQSQGKKVGLITTSALEDATPAAFAAHQPSRRMLEEIAQDYLFGSKPDLMMGGFARKGLQPEMAREAGYEVVTTNQEMGALTGLAENRVAALFGPGTLPSELDGDYSSIPYLSQMTETALKLLGSPDSPGFFLLVENENIDEFGHSNDIARQIAGTVELAKTVEIAQQWAKSHPDTLIIVTADHETGGLTVVSAPGKGQLPEVRWATDGHTTVPVPLYAFGPGADRFQGGALDNTNLVQLLTGKPRL